MILHKLTLKDHKIVKVLDIPFSCCSFDDFLEEVDNGIRNHQHGRYVSVTNTESTYHAIRIASHYQYIQDATFSCCDGIGIVLAGRMLGHRIPRLHGPDIMLRCCEYGVDKGWRHFFYGGKEGVPDLLSRKLAERFPGLITVGAYSPPFRQLTPNEDEAIIEKINKANPDILWVGLGLLKQERWIAHHLRKIPIPWMIGVGAAFDFHAGTIKRAPLFYRSIGLEWLYRVVFEPRMIIRNLYSFSLLINAIQYALRHKIHRKNQRHPSV